MRRVAAIAALGLGLLAGCGGTDDSTPYGLPRRARPSISKKAATGC